MLGANEEPNEHSLQQNEKAGQFDRPGKPECQNDYGSDGLLGLRSTM